MIMKVLFCLCSLLVSINIFAKEFKVAALYWSMNIQGQVAMRNGLESEAKLINEQAKKKNLPTIKIIPYVAGDSEEGIKNQINQMDQVIEKGEVDLMIVQPTNNAALSAGLQKANLKKIPVITYDQSIMGGNIVSFITSNNYQAGYIDGEYIASLYSNDYEIKLIIVEYPQVSSTVERVDGLFDALKKNNQKHKVLKRYRAVEPISGKKAGEDILKDFPTKNSVDVIFTVNDGGGLSVVDVLSEAKRNEIKVATIDGDPKSVKNIQSKRLTVIDSAQFCAELGRQSIKVAYRYLRGEKVPTKILVPTFPITLETLPLYPGWDGAVPKSFKKHWREGIWDNKILEFY